MRFGKISEKTVADLMRRQVLVARRIKRKRRTGLTKQDKAKTLFPHLLNRDLTADWSNVR